MVDTEKVSVVIPVYNNEKFLNESINSILKQTYTNIETIAVNDGSTDESLKILNQYSDKITIINQENKGLARALQTGIEHISGKWFKWFSPDDVLLPKSIETLVETITKLPPDTIVYSNWNIIDENGKLLRSFSESNFNNCTKFDFNVRLLDGQQININTSLIPVTLFERGCKFQNLADPVVIDYDFFLRAALFFNTSFHLIPKSLLLYRIHKNQLSHTNISDTLVYVSEIRKKFLSNLENSKKTQYLIALKKYQKKKPILKKTMELGLEITSKTLPSSITNRLIIFYLNKIRRTR